MRDQKERDRDALASFGIAIGGAIKGRKDVRDSEYRAPEKQSERAPQTWHETNQHERISAYAK